MCVFSTKVKDRSPSAVCVYTGVRVVTNPMVYLEINMELNSKTNVDESTIYIYTVWSNNIISKRPELPAILHRYMANMYIRTLRIVQCALHSMCVYSLLFFRSRAPFSVYEVRIVSKYQLQMQQQQQYKQTQQCVCVCVGLGAIWVVFERERDEQEMETRQPLHV